LGDIRYLGLLLLCGRLRDCNGLGRLWRLLASLLRLRLRLSQSLGLRWCTWLLGLLRLLGRLLLLLL
jgi:hypothetical protein